MKIRPAEGELFQVDGHDKINLMFIDIHSSVHIGNIYLCSIKGPTRCTFLCIVYSSLFLALHVSGAICTHPQEHNCSVQP
jgi:hypothetical protein